MNSNTENTKPIEETKVAESENLEMRRLTLSNLPPMPPLPEGYTLRLYCAGDDERLAALLDAAFTDIEWDMEKVQHSLVNDPEVKATYIVVHDPTDTLVATASVQMFHTKSKEGDPLPPPPQTVGRVHWVATDPAHRGKKLGYIVSLATMLDFAQRGCTEGALTTQTFRLAAIRVYQSLGFVPDTRHGEAHDARWARVITELSKSR